eukprot:SAG22_NODE_14_length_33165_cov_13.196698_45_plen_90_part_00
MLSAAVPRALLQVGRDLDPEMNCCYEKVNIAIATVLAVNVAVLCCVVLWCVRRSRASSRRRAAGGFASDATSTLNPAVSRDAVVVVAQH